MDTKYNIHTDLKYSFLEKIDIQDIIKSCQDQWFNQTLCQVNDCVVRLGIVQGEFHWHKHDEEDEFFFVIDGKLWLDYQAQGEERSIELLPQQGFTVPKGITHRTRAQEKTTMLMIEKSTIVPTGV